MGSLTSRYLSEAKLGDLTNANVEQARGHGTVSVGQGTENVWICVGGGSRTVCQKESSLRLFNDQETHDIAKCCAVIVK